MLPFGFPPRWFEWWFPGSYAGLISGIYGPRGPAAIPPFFAVTTWSRGPFRVGSARCSRMQNYGLRLLSFWPASAHAVALSLLAVILLVLRTDALSQPVQPEPRPGEFCAENNQAYRNGNDGRSGCHYHDNTNQQDGAADDCDGFPLR